MAIFRGLIDNAELAIAKTDLKIALSYAELAVEDENSRTITSLLKSEFERVKSGLLCITGNDEMLEKTPWLKESIRVRNRYVNPLNMIQIELLKKAKEYDNENLSTHEELKHLTTLSIKAIASGLRTTG